MSESSDRGKKLERAVAALLRKKLGAKVIRDPRSGAGAFHKTDIKDWYGAVPFSIEVKNQATIKLPEWWRQAKGNASYRQPPALVFALDEEVLATVRLGDLVDLVAELGEQRKTIADLRAPINSVQQLPPVHIEIPDENVYKLSNSQIDSRSLAMIDPPLGMRNPYDDLIALGDSLYCRNGHLLNPGDTKCLAKGCIYGHYPSKVKKGKQ